MPVYYLRINVQWQQVAKNEVTQGGNLLRNKWRYNTISFILLSPYKTGIGDKLL